MASPTALTDKNLYAYCDNNPVIRIDEYGDMWELAVAGGGKEHIKHPKGFHGNKRPHYHPNVKNNYRLTPHGSSSHDHYFYPR